MAAILILLIGGGQSNARCVAGLDTTQLRASVDLIRALGGGWGEDTG